jgi:hypothetical protein
VNSAVTNPAPAVVFADEVHASPVLAIVIAALPCAVFLSVATNAAVPVPGLRLFTVLILPITAVALLPWRGFHYLFSPAGVEIRTLGFRLRFIPADEIRSYSAEPWSAIRGYGIRGIGACKAYVWGNRGVRIWTTTGEVFLGHDNPGKIIRDLDLVTNHQGHEVTRRS